MSQPIVDQYIHYILTVIKNFKIIANITPILDSMKNKPNGELVFFRQA